MLGRSARSTQNAWLAALLVSWACGGSGGESTGVETTPEIAAVVVVGAPNTTVMVGESVTLVATATNATGGVVSGPTVSWTSSAPTVASVSSSGLVRALSSGRATITASVGTHDGSVALDVADGATVGIQGGVVTAAGGAVKLEVPAGGVALPTLILVRSVSNPLADPRLVAGTAFELGPIGSAMRGTLTLRFDPAGIPSGLAVESLQLYTQSGNGWVLVGGSKVDVAAKTVTGFIFGAGVYVIRSTPVARIDVIGGLVGGALFVGQSTQLTASLIGAANETLPARTLAWTSSDPSKVTVDGTGKVTALAVGTATITVSTDGKSATAPITVLAGVTPDWSRATDWTTYQGDSRHSGYVDATLDPAVFKEKWTSTLTTSGSMNAPTVGGGQLYLTTNYYFSGQQLFALDPATGTKRWTRDFGPIFGLNQATYYAGNVYVTTGGHEDTFLWGLKETDGSLKFQTSFSSQWEHWKAPVIAGSYLVSAGGYYGGMYGFDLATGAQTFFKSGPQVDGWAPVALNGTVYRTGGSELTAVNPANGNVTGTLTDARLAAVTTPVIGEANDLLTIVGNRLMSIDLGAMSVKWEQSGSYAGMPVVGKGVVYGFSGTVVAARRESDGNLLWSWQPPAPYTQARPASSQSIALTNNLLLVSLAGGSYGEAGMSFAIDLASHLTVWSYPMSGDLALSSQGFLFISQGGKVAGISVK
ncbi:MAG: Ig-like domain-containing protein [Gemmatimonadaceae bacterium]